MTTEERRAYNKAYRMANRARLRAYDRERRGPGGPQREVKLAYDRARSKALWEEVTPEQRAKAAAATAKRRAENPAKAKEGKQRYYRTEKGRVQKKLGEARYAAKGLRAASEKRRAASPLSAARLTARVAYQLQKRAGQKQLGEFDAFVLKEAVRFSRLREKMCGGKWHVDHVVPISKGGSSTHENLQVVPAEWNRSKSNRNSTRLFAI